MLRPRYLLAFLDENQESKWRVINRQFILEKNTDGISGVFLQDLWFNYKLKESYSNNDKPIKFMIIKSRHKVNKLNELLSNEFGNIIDLSEECYGFILRPGDIMDIYTEMYESKNIKYNCKLFCENTNILFRLEIIKFDNEYYITLPKFLLNFY
tara:strand:+ start:7418 stop:7879 length:462 start_codon:yes stop_codon:yes gene_type:complete